MNRRNTMIVATAVNAVLLAVLFMTARHSEQEIEYSQKIAPIKILEPVPVVDKAKLEKKPEVIAKPSQVVRNPVVSKAELAAQFADKNPKTEKESSGGSKEISSTPVESTTPVAPEISVMNYTVPSTFS